MKNAYIAVTLVLKTGEIHLGLGDVLLGIEKILL